MTDSQPDADPLAPVTVIVGQEELLVDRAVAEVTSAIRAAEPAADVRELGPGTLQPGMLAELTSPSLFGERKAVVVRSAQHLPDVVASELATYVAAAADDVALALTFTGGGKGPALLDAARKAGAREVACPKITRPGDRVVFVRQEFRRAGRTITEPAAGALLEAVGSDLREIASACSQLVSDTAGTADETVVGRYYTGRAEVTSFAVADRAVEGRPVDALEQLRWALSVGVAPVLVTSALAQALRNIARLTAAPRGLRGADLARELGLPPWKVDRVRQQRRGWTDGGLSVALRAVAEADAAIKGGGDDPAYALEKAVVTVARARDGTPQAG
ncbi:MAG: DNA polymerase III subunit delta [Streptomycetales bacterium]